MTACWDQAIPGGLRDKSQGVEGQVRHRLETLHTTTPTPSEQSQRPLPSPDSFFLGAAKTFLTTAELFGQFFALFLAPLLFFLLSTLSFLGSG